MKKMKLFVVFLIVLFVNGLPINTRAQEKDPPPDFERINNKYVPMPFEVEQAEFKEALDKVLPGATYEERLYNGMLPVSYGTFINYKDEWFSIWHFDEIIFNRKLESDAGSVQYSDEDLIKAYVYLRHFPYVTAQNDRSKFFKGAPYSLNIHKIDEIYDTSLLLNEYKEKGYTNTKLNYEVIFEWNKDFYSPRIFKVSYKFNIANGEIVSILQKNYSNIIDFSTGELYVHEECESLFFPEYSPESETYKHSSRYWIMQDVKKKKGAVDGKTLLNNSWNKVEFVPNGNSANLDIYVSRTNTNFLHMRTAIYLQGVPQLTYYKTKFKVYNASTLAQPIFKVYTYSLFGSKDLLFESPIVTKKPAGFSLTGFS